MEEDRLTHLLHELPRERALAGFTARVLRHLDEGGAGPRLVAVREQLRHLPHHGYRWTAATVTLTAFCLSAVLLQREHTPPAFSPVQTPATSPLAHLGPLAPGTALSSLEAARSGNDGSLAGRRASRLNLQAMALGAGATAGGRFDSTRTRREVRSIREQGQLERELRSMRRSGAAPPPMVYLGGDENGDLVLNSGHTRGLIPPASIEHNPDDNNFLD
jgi:hypothetical protein